MLSVEDRAERRALYPWQRAALAHDRLRRRAIATLQDALRQRGVESF